jgi:hypothetical protein
LPIGRNRLHEAKRLNPEIIGSRLIVSLQSFEAGVTLARPSIELAAASTGANSAALRPSPITAVAVGAWPEAALPITA